MANPWDKYQTSQPWNKYKSPNIEGDQQEESSFSDQAFGALETIGTIASSIPATIAGGVTGAATALFSGDPAAGEAVRKGVTESLTYKGGVDSQKQLESLGEAVTYADENIVKPAMAGTAGIVDVALNPYSNVTQGFEPAKETVRAIKEQGLPRAAGNEVLEKTGSPLLATIIETFAATAPDLAGGLGALSKIKPPNLKFNKKPNVISEKIAEQIKAGTTDKEFVKKMVDGAGKVVKDKKAIETIKQGFDEGVVSTIKGSSDIDKRRMLQMVDKLEKGKKNALYSAKNRPADVAGDSLLRKVDFVKKNNSDAGKQLDVVAKRLKGKNVDVSSAVNTFLKDAENMGVTFDDKLVPNFEGSNIETIAPARKLIKDLTSRIRRNENPDAFQSHEFKKFIDENVSFGKRKAGLGGKTESIAKKLRKNIDEVLDSEFPDYNEANTRYSDTIGVLDSLQDASGSKVNLFGPNAEKAMGTVLRRLMSNTQSRVNLMDSIKDVEAVSRKYGGDFGDDILTQMLFADELDAMFGSPARTSFQGEIKKAIGNKSGITERVIDYAGDVAEKARGINEKNAIKAIKTLLSGK